MGNMVSMEECVKLLYKKVESFVEHPSAKVVDILDKKVNPREQFTALFDFENQTLREDVYKECVKVIEPLLREADPDGDEEDLQMYVTSRIKWFVRWVERRNAHGDITWSELLEHLNMIPWDGGNFGLRIQLFGKVYCELRFNYMDDWDKDYLKFYHAEYPDGDGEEESDILISMASYVGISSDGIESIHMGQADLIYGVGLRDVTITYANGEKVFLRFSEDN